ILNCRLPYQYVLPIMQASGDASRREMPAKHRPTPPRGRAREWFNGSTNNLKWRMGPGCDALAALECGRPIHSRHGDSVFAWRYRNHDQRRNLTSHDAGKQPLRRRPAIDRGFRLPLRGTGGDLLMAGRKPRRNGAAERAAALWTAANWQDVDAVPGHRGRARQGTAQRAGTLASDSLF